MTNGEKIQTILDVDRDCTEVHGENGTMTFTVTQDFWNAEYKEPTTKNDLGVDLISRTDAIRAMQDKAKKLTNEDTINGLCGAVAILFEMPSVTPQPRWISVKNRLPQKGEYGDVLVTFIPPAGTLWATVMIARYSDLMGIAKPCFHIGEVGKESFENITPQVIAWMPLPEGYKESEE